MASMTIIAAALFPSSTSIARQPPPSISTSSLRSFKVLNSSSNYVESENPNNIETQNFPWTQSTALIDEKIRGEGVRNANGRRGMVFSAVSVAAWSVAMAAMALYEEQRKNEPKRGTPEARKKYAAVCVTMPTARICNK